MTSPGFHAALQEESMRERLIISAIAVLFLMSPVIAKTVDLGIGLDGVTVNVQQSDDQHTILQYQIGSFQQLPVTIEGKEYFSLFIDREATLMDAGEPALPQISRSIIIPDNAGMKVNIIESEYIEITDILIAPSKGHLSRTINPSDVPFEFGSVYSSDIFYPADQVSLRVPYILRDYRGIVIELNPFQYNPVTQTLRVYTSITVEVINAGPGQVNLFDNRRAEAKLIGEFERIYQTRFINYQFYQNKYSQVDEHGDLLIITYDDFHDALLPLVEWKRQKGIKTTLVDVGTIGNNTSSIDSYIQTMYDDPTQDLAFVLIVGDAAQVTTPIVGGGGSDPSYTLLAGGDSYPDAFIGRFSAQTLDQVETQVERTITYEKTPVGSDWFHKASGVASSEGAGVGHNGESDYAHMGLIRDDLLGYTYTVVDEFYETNGASASQITTALNQGRGFMNYCGHGSNTAWSTTGYSNTNVNNLTNDNMLPFIISVACVNGNFVDYTCFAEAWLRATHNGVPTGAIGTYMSTVNQDWVPPMHAEDEVTDLLTGDIMRSYGGLCFNGSCKMIDLSGSAGISEYKNWHIFGDPSLEVRTDNPVAMTVNHDAVALIGVDQFSLQVVGVEGAMCALYANGIIYGTAYSSADGSATISMETALPIGDNVTLTVTAYNMQPYIADVQVITPDGPYLLCASSSMDDVVGGNGNGLIDYGENIIVGLELINVGPDEATNVTAVLSSIDSYITIIDNTESFGSIAGNNGTASVGSAFSFDVAGDIPTEHLLQFTVIMTDINDSNWTETFSMTSSIHYPDCQIATNPLDEYLDGGAQSTQEITLYNDGPAPLDFSISCVMFDGKNGAFFAKPDATNVERQLIDMRISSDDKSEYESPLFATVARSNGGPDTFGYSWIDSDDAAGPEYDWIDISGDGTEIMLGDDNSLGPFDIGFTFPYYENGYDQLYIGSNGIISFGAGWSSRQNTGLPNGNNPNDLISIWWDDLDPAESGHVYYYYDPLNEYFIVSFDAVPNYASPTGTGSLSFQAILYPNGRIVMQYGTMDPGSDVELLTGSTIGIEDSEGSDGLEVVYNAEYMHDNLAISFKAARWMSISPGNGTIAPFSSELLTISFDAGDLENGLYGGQLNLTTNDPTNPSLTIPVNLSVIAFVCGDANGDDLVNVADAVFLINFVFKQGASPDPLASGDANDDGIPNVADAVFLINYAFKHGPPPVCQ